MGVTWLYLERRILHTKHNRNQAKSGYSVVPSTALPKSRCMIAPQASKH
jgi:hypothetical protein